jgi:hypothetical protein
MSRTPLRRLSFGAAPLKGSRAFLAGLALLLTQPPAFALADSERGSDSSSGFYLGAGIAAVRASARASGSLSEREWDSSAALRIEVGYVAKLSNSFSLGGELYDLPARVELGLGDKTTNIVGLALIPAYAVLPDIKLFLLLGVERARTNSPVADWRNFNTNTPVYGGGLSYSLAHALRMPVSVTARVEQANYERITYIAQTDQFKQTRYGLSADWHF